VLRESSSGQYHPLLTDYSHCTEPARTAASWSLLYGFQ
jgi:hypothetical protein